MRTAAALLRPAWALALLALGAVVLAAPWGRFLVTLVLVVAAVLPALLLRGAVRVGMSRWFAASILVLLSLLGGYLATSAAGLGLAQTVRDVVPRLLTAPQPYDAAPDLLAAPALLAAVVGLLVGLRWDSRLRVEPVAGGLVLYLSGMLLTAGTADPWGLVAALIVVLALLGWVLADEHTEPAGIRLSLAAPLAVVGAGALAAVATVPVSAAFEPREAVDPPVRQVVASTPLAQLGAWAVNPTVPLLRVAGPEVPLRLVVLDEYDGTSWTSATTFADLRTDGRTGLEVGDHPRASTVTVAFEGLGGSWLPSPGTPTTVGLGAALVDPGTGTLYAPEEAAVELGTTYEVAGSYDDPPLEVLETARVPDAGTDPDVARWTALPPLSTTLADYARRIGADAATPYEKAQAIERQLRRTYTLSPRAPSGSALWRLDDFLLGDPDERGARVGTAEQFAASFALIARYNGLPARVVMGFRPGTDQGDGTRLITGEDAFAWAEVNFGDLGWVPFSPSPDDDTFVRQAPVESRQPDLPDEADTGTPSPTPSADATGVPAPEPVDEPTDAGADAVGPSGPAGQVHPGVVATAALLTLLLALLALRSARRWRHARAGAGGAWAEVVDALRLAGLPVLAHEPADVVASRADHRLGLTAATPVAEAAQRVAFAPAGGAGPASSVREQVRTVRRAARRTVPLWRRWLWWVDPRVLRR